MKYFKVFILLVLFTFSIVVSRKFKKHHKKGSPIPLQDYLPKIPQEKLNTFLNLADSAKKSCRSQCTIHKRTLFHISGDSFVCQCFSSIYVLEKGVWEEVKKDLGQVKKMLDEGDQFILIE